MANIASKLAIGGSVIVVLLMMFSAVPIAAEESNDDPDYENISVEYMVPDSGEHSDNWSWDCENCVLTLKNTVYAQNISINNNPGNNGEYPTVTVNVLGDVYIDRSGGILDFFGNFSGATIVGSGTIIFDVDPYGICYRGKGDLIIDGVTLNFICGPVKSESNLIIKNCPMVKASYDDYCPITANGFIEVINSNLYLTGRSDTGLMSAPGGIVLPYEPTSPDGTLEYNHDPAKKWGENITFISIPGDHIPCSLTMESYIPSSEESSVNMYEVSLYSVAAVSVALVLVGSIYAGKH